MSIDQGITGLIYIAAVFLLLLLAKLIYGRLNPRIDLRHQLFEKDNFAFSLEVVGYYLGLLLALGGLLAGPSAGWVDDLIDIFFFGILTLILLNLSAWINDKIILSRFDNTKEIIEDQNAGTGAIEAGNHIANGLILAGAISGQGGDLLTALAFWGLGQVVLIIAGLVYNACLPFDLHDEVEKDNVAVGVAFAGVLIAVGNIVRFATEGDFMSWWSHLSDFALFALIGLILLPVVRWGTDVLLVPGVKLTDELVNQDKPNVGAGLLEAFSYVAASMLIGWTL